MDRVQFIQTEGFPWDVNILNFAQNATQISQNLGEIIAPLAIVKGCIENGNNVSDGLVYINGELLPFKGGFKQNVVRIIEQAEKRELETKKSFDCLITRYATFGASAGTTYNYSDFYRTPTIKQIEEKLNDKTAIEKLVERVNKLEVFARPFVSGFGAVLFLRPANEIPEGWEEVTDLRGRMPVGLNTDDNDFDELGKTGGRKSHVLTKANLPSNLPSQVLTFNGTTPTALGVKTDTNFWVKTESLAGNNEAINLLNPYRIVIFIKPII